jgi:hypothetical protein
LQEIQQYETTKTIFLVQRFSTESIKKMKLYFANTYHTYFHTLTITRFQILLLLRTTTKDAIIYGYVGPHGSSI